ncbi:YolD-like family protein [Calidifontibacillus erzurumensis]|uniref:YolD-like family protein n=1 Tax=Calidifontibacillus erzurumensis TaxID=2741433 RepID=A0A8J8GF32_9BACI|nr:YolD-like family protein [Calidifontibacillus erzurumensis]NSL50656.1 YolD-like family protein [Calidifontibacillus erzurumensis]
MIKDRGTIKWTAMMLPEHVHEIRELWANDRKLPKRSLDEQQLELINYTIQQAMTENTSVKITYYENGCYLEKIGYIKKIDPLSSQLYLHTLQGEKINIDIFHVLEVLEINMEDNTSLYDEN